MDYPPTRAYTVEVLGDGSGHTGVDTVYTPGDPATATVTVTDDDALQVVTIHPTAAFVAEGGEVSIIFRRTGDTSEALPIVFYRAHGFPGNSFDPDFTRIELFQSSFGAGESEFTFSGFFECFDDEFCDDDVVNSTYPYVFLFQIYGDGGRYGLHRVWRAGNPDTATIVFYDDDRSREIELQTEYPNSGEVGETVRVNFTVLNSGSEATGNTITVSSIQRTSGDGSKVKPAEPRVGCTITGPLAPGATGTCQATFVLTTQDLMDSPMTLDSTATDGTATSSPVRVLIKVLNGVAIGFTETTRLSVTEPEYGEANTQAVLRVMRVGESDEEVQVAYTLEPVRTRNRAYAADVGVDYVDDSATPGVITFRNRDTEKNITIDILGDEIEEQQELFRVTLHPPHGVRTLEGMGDRVVAITDTTPPGKSYKPTAGLTLVSPDPTPESAGSIDFAVVLDRVWGEDARFEVELDAHNNLTATPAFPRLGRTGDFEDPNGIIRVTIPAGQTRFEFSLALYDDDLREEDETFQLLLGSSINKHLRLIGENDQVLVTIADDDFVEPSEINLALTHANAAFESATEGSAQRDITVTATFPGIRWPTDAADAPLRPAEPRTVDTVVRVQVDAANSTAGETDLEQFQAADAQSMFRQVEFLDVVIPAGQTSGAATLRIKPTEDAVDEDDEAVVLLGTEVVGTDSEAQLPVTSASFSIVDDDTRGVTVAPEGVHLLRRIYMDENATYTYTMVLDSEPTEPVTIGVRPKNANRYLSISPATLTFTASNWNVPQEIEVSALEDGSKDAGVVFVDITHEVSGGDYDDVTTEDIFVGIRDTTQAYIYLDDAQASESDGHIEFTVSVRPAIYASPVHVRYATMDGTAVAGTDYTREVDEGKSYKVFTVPSGGSGTIRIPIADDQVYESPDKTFSLQLTLHNERALLEGGATSLTATGTIRDDDPKPVVSVAGPAGAVSYVSENAKGPVTFTLTLTGQSEEDVTVSYATGGAALARLNGRSLSRQALAAATAGMDYTPATGSVAFSSGETTKRVTVQVTNDDLSEDTEFFGLTISNSQNAQIRNAATEQTADVGLLDDDPRGVTIDPISINLREPSSGQTASSSSYAVKLDSMPTDIVTVTIGGAASAVSLSGNTLSSANTLTFTTTNWNEGQTVTVTPVKDGNGTSETVTLTHVPMGGDYTGIAADSVTVNVTDSDERTILLSPASIALTEGDESGVSYTVKLSTQPTGDVSVGIGGHAGTDLTISGNTLANDQLTFTTSNWDAAQTVVVRAGHDHDDDDETETLTHTASGGDYSSITKGLSATIDDDAPETLTVSFAQSSYTVAEGASVTVTVTLNADPERDVTIPLTTTDLDGASSADYSGVPPNVSFNSGETEQTFTFSATQDTANDDGERVRLGFSTLPAGVTAVSPNQATVSITDDDVPSVTVSFAQSDYTVAEGASVTVTVNLDADPEREVTIPLTTTDLDGASSADYSGVPPNVSFNSGETEQTFTFEATQDTSNDDDERVRLGFGPLPTGVTAGTPNQATVSITDDDVPSVTVSFAQSDYTVAEGASVTVTVNLDADPEREVTIPLTTTDLDGASSADYSGVPPNVSFNSGETEQTFTFEAAQDTANDDGERVRVGFSTLPAGVTAAAPYQATVAITDDDVPSVTVSFAQSDYTVAEGASVTVTVNLDADPERTVTIPLTTTDLDDASAADYSGVPPNVTFNSGETEQTFTFEATQDTANDDGERVRLGFGPLPTGVTAAAPYQATVAITDDDVPLVTVSFAQSDYTVAEGGEVTVTINLDADPEREVTIPLTTTDLDGASSADYSGVPPSVTFNSGETEQTFTFEATQDTANDDGERVRLGFGPLPTGVTAAAPYQATVSITDDDVPAITVSFGQYDYTAAEGASVTVTVELSADPERSVTVPLTTTDLDGASSADYSVPSRVTFSNGDTSKTITFSATQDSIDDDDEKVRVGFSALPTGVTAVTPAQAMVAITDDDTKGIVIDPVSLTVTEGDSLGASYTVKLSSQPVGDVTVSITGHYCTNLTLSGSTLAGRHLTFTPDNWDTTQTVTVDATYDHNAVDDEESLIHTAYRGGYSNITDDLSVSVTDDAAYPLSVQGVVPAPTRVERPDQDFPSTYDTWGFVDTSATSSGTLEETGYSGECSRDAWTLRVQNNLRYRVEVFFDPTTTPNANRGGGIGFPGRGDRWDHNRDDGRSFIEFTANRDSYLLEVKSRDFMNEDGLSYFGPYTITLTVIGYDSMVNNVPDYSDENHSVGDSRAGQTNRNIWLATSFTTGPSDDGYKLEYVATNLFRRMGNSSVKAALFSDSSGSPGTKIFDFERINQITGAPYPRRDRFWAPSTAEVLAANSTYWVVLMDENSPRTGYGVASTKGGTDFRGETGWSIGSNSATYDDEADSPSWTVSSTLTAMVLEVWASTVRIELATEGVTEAVDQMAPQLKSAYVYFASMILTFDEGLVPNSTPPPSAFTVNVNGSPLEVTGVRLSEDTVDLSLSWWVEAGDTVTLDYTAHMGETDGKLRDAAGNTVASFSGQAITNHTESTTGAEQSEMSGEGKASSGGELPAAPTNLQVFPHQSGRLRATWQAPDSGPSPDGYTVQWKTATGNWQDPDQDAEMDVTKTFYVINGLEDGVEYAVRVVATSNDIDGDPSAEVTATPQETTPPILQSATVDGSSLTLTFDEELDNSEFLSSSLFAVDVNGEARSVIGVAVGQSNVVLLLSPAVAADDSVTVDYSAPTEETATRLQDRSGNAVESFVGQRVTNETQAADPPPPQQNSPASGAPTITGTAQVGETLTAVTSGIRDDDGFDNQDFDYQWLADDADIGGATGRTYTLVADDEGKTVKVRVSFTDDAGNEESLTSAATAAVAAATPAAIPEDEEEETILLSASAFDVPESHDGNTTIIFELRFSEQIPLSYKILRDHAFTVTGGEVVKARRLEPGSSDSKNVRWEISVTPDGNGAVVIVLPPTTDCEADGALCTKDGRGLSNRLEISVPGTSE